MLLGLSFNSLYSYDDKENFGTALAQLMEGRVNVFESRNLDEYIKTLQKYKPAKGENLILINTHFDYFDDLTTAMWRTTDIAFNQKGGVIFGEKPRNESTVYKNKFLFDNPQMMIDSAAYYGNRAAQLSKEVRHYFGRADSDPHTIIFGFIPRWPDSSVYSESVLMGLPDEWWQGVAYCNPHQKRHYEEVYRGVVDRFPYASHISVGDNAEETLNALEVPHRQADKVRFNSEEDCYKYGKYLRTLSRLDAERVVE